MIALMPPEMQKRNIHRLFTRIELNDEGEAVRVEVKPRVSSAFTEVVLALELPNGPKGAEGGDSEQRLGRFATSEMVGININAMEFESHLALVSEPARLDSNRC